ncbi:MAG: HAMP domain-containing protein [Clostridiaceae bacterium]|jgi:methyl-accepting chemotaxis protein|nr:HAMP domain-containing protein [Clostridiaceae bacterium]
MSFLRWKNLKIGLKYNFALFTTILLVIFAAAYVTMSLYQIRDAIDEIQTVSSRAVQLTQMSAIFKSKELVILDYISLPRERLVNEYKALQEEFNALQESLRANIHTRDGFDMFSIIEKNNETVDDAFHNEIIPKSEEEAIMAIVKVSGLRDPTELLFERIKDEVDEEMELVIHAASQDVQNAIVSLIISIISALTLGTVIVFLISRNISRNLYKVVNVLNQISDGNLNVETIRFDGKDEVAQLSGSINKTLLELKGIIRGIKEAADKVESESTEMKRVAVEGNSGIGHISDTMTQMSAGAEEQASSASDIAGSISALSGLIETANQNQDDLQNSSEDILKVVGNGTRQMEDSVDKMQQIHDVFQDTVQKVRIFDERLDKISDLIQIINTIAKQTNLLALNAAIEAARAGEAGKGFAVVSDEIRKLSEQVAKSVREITDMVTRIQAESKFIADSLENGYENVREGTANIQVTGEIFNRIQSEVYSMVDKVNHVSAGLEEISDNVQKVNTAVENVAAISEENSAGIEETAASISRQNELMNTIADNAGVLSLSAERLKQMTGRFQV